MLQTIIELSILSGGLLPLMALLLVITLAVIIERGYFFSRVIKAGNSMEHDVQLVKYQGVNDLVAVANHYEGTVQAGLLTTAIASRGDSADDMDRHIEETILWQLPKFDKNMWMLDTSVTLAPLMGLFGTIIGMIESFNVLGTAGGGNPNAVTAGIAHALIATGFGLVIAIVAIIFLNYFNKRVRLALHQMELIKVMVINRLHGGGASHQGQPLEKGLPVMPTASSLAGAR